MSDRLFPRSFLTFQKGVLGEFAKEAAKRGLIGEITKYEKLRGRSIKHTVSAFARAFYKSKGGKEYDKLVKSYVNAAKTASHKKFRNDILSVLRTVFGKSMVRQLFNSSEPVERERNPLEGYRTVSMKERIEHPSIPLASAESKIQPTIDLPDTVYDDDLMVDLDWNPAAEQQRFRGATTSRLPHFGPYRTVIASNIKEPYGFTQKDYRHPFLNNPSSSTAAGLAEILKNLNASSGTVSSSSNSARPAAPARNNNNNNDAQAAAHNSAAFNAIQTSANERVNSLQNEIERLQQQADREKQNNDALRQSLRADLERERSERKKEAAATRKAQDEASERARRIGELESEVDRLRWDLSGMPNKSEVDYMVEKAKRLEEELGQMRAKKDELAQKLLAETDKVEQATKALNEVSAAMDAMKAQASLGMANTDDNAAMRAGIEQATREKHEMFRKKQEAEQRLAAALQSFELLKQEYTQKLAAAQQEQQLQYNAAVTEIEALRQSGAAITAENEELNKKILEQASLIEKANDDLNKALKGKAVSDDKLEEATKKLREMEAGNIALQATVDRVKEKSDVLPKVRAANELAIKEEDADEPIEQLPTVSKKRRTDKYEEAVGETYDDHLDSGPGELSVIQESPKELARRQKLVDEMRMVTGVDERSLPLPNEKSLTVDEAYRKLQAVDRVFREEIGDKEWPEPIQKILTALMSLLQNTLAEYAAGQYNPDTTRILLDQAAYWYEILFGWGREFTKTLEPLVMESVFNPALVIINPVMRPAPNSLIGYILDPERSKIVNRTLELINYLEGAEEQSQFEEQPFMLGKDQAKKWKLALFKLVRNSAFIPDEQWDESLKSLWDPIRLRFMEYVKSHHKAEDTAEVPAILHPLTVDADKFELIAALLLRGSELNPQWTFGRNYFEHFYNDYWLQDFNTPEGRARKLMFLLPFIKSDKDGRMPFIPYLRRVMDIALENAPLIYAGNPNLPPLPENPPNMFGAGVLKMKKVAKHKKKRGGARMSKKSFNPIIKRIEYK